MKTKSILISGASIAGPALAFWLNKYGFKTTIIERAPGIRPGGYAVDFRGAAMKALEKMGIVDEIKKLETRTGKITVVNKYNKKVTSLPDGFTSGELEIMRGDLANLLYDLTKNDTEYIFNDSISGLTEVEDGVIATFDRGQARAFDLVIGADGLHSKVREVAFGSEEQFMRHLGLYIAIFTVPNYMDLGMDALYYSTIGKKVGIFGAPGENQARASFYFASNPIKYNKRNSGDQTAILRNTFAGMEWQVPQLLRLMDQAPDFYFDSISQIKMDSWSSGRIALIGDAAHCGSPMSGMGTSMAIIGAYILAGELKQADGDHAFAFKNYEEEMREFVNNCQKMAEGVEWFVPTTRFRFWMSNLFWKILPYTPWKNMMIEMPLKVANSITLKEY